MLQHIEEFSLIDGRDYQQVPPLRKDDNILPSASEIPALLSNFRNPRRRRVSIGPQSEADAREHLANREIKRKASQDAVDIQHRGSRSALRDEARHEAPLLEEPLEQAQDKTVDGVSNASLQARGSGTNLLSPSTNVQDASSDSSREDEKNDRRMFSLLQKPRTHYDVEVITKLIVYTGIAWLAVEWNPVLFAYLGLN